MHKCRLIEHYGSCETNCVPLYFVPKRSKKAFQLFFLNFFLSILNQPDKTRYIFDLLPVEDDESIEFYIYILYFLNTLSFIYINKMYPINIRKALTYQLYWQAMFILISSVLIYLYYRVYSYQLNKIRMTTDWLNYPIWSVIFTVLSETIICTSLIKVHLVKMLKAYKILCKKWNASRS